MTTVRRALLLLAAGAAVVLGACGEDSPEPAAGPSSPADTATTGADGTAGAPDRSAGPSTAASTTAAPTTSAADLTTALAGRTFLSSSIEGFTLVDGTQVELAFTGADLAANAGCNQLAGTWSVEGDVLVVPPMIQTQMACEPSSLMDQDTWLASVLMSRPAITLDGDTLTLAAPGATVTLVDREVADPDRPLEGVVWTVDTLVTGDAASSLPAGGRPPTLRFEAGTLAVDTGCNTGRGGYAIEGDTVTFQPIAITRMACVDPGASSTEQHVLAVLSGSATVSIEAGTLTLANGADGLVARAPATGGAPTGDGLVGPVWRLESTASAGATTPVPALERIPTLRFDGTTVTVDAGCNTGSGSYTVDADRLTFGPIAMSLMLCTGPAGDVEATILGVLGGGAVTYSVGADGALEITDGNTTLRYVS